MSKKKIIYLLLSLFLISSIVGFIVYFYKNEKKVLKYLEEKTGYTEDDPKSNKINTNVHYNNSRLQSLYVKKDGTIYFSVNDKINGKDYNDYKRYLYVEDYDEYLYYCSSNDKLLSILKRNRLYQTSDIYYANFIYKYLYGHELDKFLKKQQEIEEELFSW